MAATLAVVVMTAGCGGKSAGAKTAGGPANATTGVTKKPAGAAPSHGTLLERAAGTWKFIATPTDDSLDTLVVKDGRATAKGAKLSCTGTFVPTKKDGRESATITYKCQGGKDGRRGLGHLKVDPDGSSLVIDFDGPPGGWGGPVDSYRRA
ncbi:hypothetical protein [Streptomyces alanosinicus]|uniref:hypothetical protein n=1 Tax=Streptomyces alanosinicus TaxID=68171 RepID=UPI001677BA0E|nr:hypothetical protein [Streptomyces alanosinicus]